MSLMTNPFHGLLPGPPLLQRTALPAQHSPVQLSLFPPDPMQYSAELCSAAFPT